VAVSERASARKRWSLTGPALEALLNRLDPDRETAGRRFEILRGKLLQYFGYEGALFPERWADETLDRVAKRLFEHSVAGEVNAYTVGVARMVLRESKTFERRDRELAALRPPEAADESELVKLEECVRKLAPAGRHLIEEYYLANSRDTAEARVRLAAELGIGGDALRSRALRIRKQLEACMRRREKSGIQPVIPTDSSRRPS
jgi:hypothetical protein